MNKSRYEGMLSGSPWIATLAFALVIGVMVNTVTIAQEAPPAPKLADDAVVEEYEPIESPRPVWPIEAARAGVEGDVVLRLTITEDGTTEDIVVVESSDERLNVGAIEAAEKSVFKPRTVNGEPVAVTGVTRTYRFQFNDITGEDLENSGP